jgi:membrane-associated phospholipid phosphatase
VVGAQITLFIAESFIVISAVMISLSRVADNYHRCFDVLVGLVIGVAIATLTVRWTVANVLM